MKASIEQIAKEVGVSIGTVSRALNNKPDVSEKTRNAVLKAVQKHQYGKEKNPSKSNTIGVVFSDSTGIAPESLPFYNQLLVTGKGSGYSINLIGSTELYSYRKTFPTLLYEKNICGLIVFTTLDEEILKEIAKDDIPMIVVNRKYDKGMNINWIFSDSRQGYLKAISYLQNLGHKDICHIQQASAGFPFSLEKETCFTEIMELLNMSVRKDRLYSVRNNPEEVELLILSEFSKKQDRPTAFISSSPPITLGVLRAFQKLGLRVPADISVIGYGNDPIFENLYPPITAITQNFEALAFNAVKSLEDMMRSSSEKRKAIHLDMPTRFVIRESCIAAN